MRSCKRFLDGESNDRDGLSKTRRNVRNRPIVLFTLSIMVLMCMLRINLESNISAKMFLIINFGSWNIVERKIADEWS